MAIMIKRLNRRRCLMESAIMRFLNEISTFETGLRVLVKVDLVFPRTDSDVDDRGCGYPKKVVCLDAIVFDEKGARMMVRMRGDVVISLFANVLREGSMFYVQYFVVGIGGEGVHRKYHIMLTPFTVVREHMGISPDHGFILMDVKKIAGEVFPQIRIRDVMGILYRVEKYG